MLGAIIGDVVGSAYEFTEYKPDMNYDMFHPAAEFTDDTILSLALAESILDNRNYVEVMKEYGKIYPNAGYGSRFANWLMGSNSFPYNSFGNGSAMRVSPIGWAYDDLETVLIKAKESAEVTHNHPEGIAGAQSTAAAIFLARTGKRKVDIKSYIEEKFGYNLNMDIEDLRKNYMFDETCQNTVPQAIVTFLDSNSFEDSIRKAMYIGGDSDTLTCINGSIAEAFYKDIPKNISEFVISKLDDKLKNVYMQFNLRYVINR